MGWAGFYVGAHGGYGWGETSISFEGVDILSIDVDGGLGGVHAGYNMQSGMWVYGVEADISGGNLSGEVLCEDADLSSLSATCGGEADYLASVRARIGWAAPSHLIYLTAGVGFTNAELSVAAGGVEITADSSLTGYVVGGGAEWKMMPNFSLRGEVLHYGFGEGDYTFLIDGDNSTVDADLDTTVVRVGASLHLN
jgi:outer membrane immunogenic protein